MSYNEWLRKCNALVARKAHGFGIDDLPDWNWYDSYEAGETPEDAVECFLEDVMQYF